MSMPTTMTISTNTKIKSLRTVPILHCQHENWRKAAMWDVCVPTSTHSTLWIGGAYSRLSTGWTDSGSCRLRHLGQAVPGPGGQLAHGRTQSLPGIGEFVD